MAKTQRLLDIDPDTGKILEDDEFTDRENLKADQDAAVDEIISEFEKSDDNVIYRASINKVPDGYKKGGKEEWCFDVDSAEIRGMKTRLRDEYGPGIYRVRLFKNSKQIRQFDYHIARPSIQKPIVQTDNSMSILVEEIRAMRDENRKLTERLLTGPATPNDPFEQMERMSNIMKNLRPAEQGGGGGSALSAKDTIDLFTRGMELAGEFKGSGEDSWISVIKEMVKGLPIDQLLANLSQARQQMPNNPRTRQLPAPQRQPMPENIRPATPVPNQQVTPAATGAVLDQNMRYLIEKASRDADPGLYAEWLLDNADPALLRQMMNEVNVLDQLAVIFPRLNQPNIRMWFNELVANVRDVLAQSGEADNSPNGIGPHNNIGNDAGSPVSTTPHAGWNSGDQNNPENNAGFGQAGETQFPNP